MSAITSPRPPQPSPTLSSTLSSTPSTSRPSSPAPPTRRANRSALRDYYNIKSAAAADASNGAQQAPQTAAPTSELDAADFDADSYVKSVLAGQGLEGVLRVEGGLINEIKGFDGERKALVYDNYSKLITATDTIRRMRSNMEPATPTTSMLGPAVGHIADVAGQLAREAREREERRSGKRVEGGDEEGEKKRRQRETVRWVIGTPRRLGVLLDEGGRGDAESDWEEVKGFLDRWDGVGGVQEIRDECDRIMGRT
ncbi:hypothetical protein MMC21_001860 [Puttea exsequens]|nr:hypothetical protein [Puttea exsequens]